MYVFGKKNNFAFRDGYFGILQLFLLVCLTCCIERGYAQTPDSIFFNPYTDSLKKGTFNYINVEGRIPGSRYRPMTAKELGFSSSAGNFEGNNLFLSRQIADDRILISAWLKTDSTKIISILLPVKHFE
jgi:hypothetical protein